MAFSPDLSRILGDYVEAYMAKDGKHLAFKPGQETDRRAYKAQHDDACSTAITLKQYQHHLPTGRYNASVGQEKRVIIGPMPYDRNSILGAAPREGSKK